MDSDGLTDLLLAGYVPLRDEGMALPCYASGPQSNAWYCALCSVPGDRAGTVVDFEPFESGDIIRLPAAAQRAVSVGDPWHDVLVWGGDCFVGTPDIILTALGDRVAELAGNAPLTLLDLAMPAQRLDRAAIVTAAKLRIDSFWGPGEASHWESDIFVRQNLLLELRRLLSGAPEAGCAELIRQLEVTASDGSMTVDVPSPLAALLRRHNAIDAFERRMETFGYETGLTLICPALTADIGPEAPELPAPAPKARAADREDYPSEILIMVSGARANQIAKLIRLPEWLPDWTVMRKGGELEPMTAGRPRDPARLPEPDVFKLEDALPVLTRYRVIIWLTDGYDHSRHSAMISEALNDLRGPVPLMIVAPTLPTQEPPAILADPKHELPDFFTLLDTAAVRSPFWSGNQKRSIDRRLADLVSATVRLTAPGTPLYDRLADQKPRYYPLLLSVASGRRAAGSSPALASEISSAGLKRKKKGHDREEYFHWKEVGRSDHDDRILSGEAAVGRHDPEFSAFVKEALRGGHKMLARDERILGEVPESIAENLRYPHLSAAFRSIEKPRSAMCVIAAESPRLSALRAAAAAGWSVVRYSDFEALNRLSEGRSYGSPLLPSDIALPSLNRLGRNRGLAVRGVDPRDIVRIPFRVFQEWREQYGRSDLAREFRRYRDDIGEWIEIPEPNWTYAVPALTLSRAIDEGLEEALFLADHPEVNISQRRRLANRTSDLRASWSEPEQETRRIIIADGKLPVQGGVLQANEIAAQKFFTIDGDASVTLLFGSRVFHVWASATITRSPSWSSRFSITRTFETFPIPEEFLIINNEEENRSQIRAPVRSRALQPLLAIADELMSEGHNLPAYTRGSGNGREVRDFEDQRDWAMMEMIGLSKKSSDLDILDRLIEMNRQSGT